MDMVEVIGIGISVIVTLLGATWNAFRKLDNRLDSVYTELKILHTSNTYAFESLGNKQSDLKERIKSVEVELKIYQDQLTDVEHFLDKKNIGWNVRRSNVDVH